MKVFLTGSVRSGTTWLFTILKTKISPSFLERFDLSDLEIRQKILSQYDQFIFKINEDIRNLEKLHLFFPTAKVIVLVRHPLEVLHSIYKPNKNSIPFRPFNDIKEKWVNPEDKSYLCAVIRRFESYYPNATQNYLNKPPCWLKVYRYEEFLKNFDTSVQNLFEFIELSDFSLDCATGPKSTPNQSVRISNFTKYEQEMINKSKVPEITKQLGYIIDS